ncbi:MAG: hypothetical protein AAGB29_11615, partial [Planctomycetota bacterium]
PQPLAISVPSEDLAGDVASAVLRIAVQRENGFGQPLRVMFNGESIDVDLSDSQGIRHYDTVQEVSIPADWVRAENDIVLSQPEPDGMMASAVLLLTTE